MRRWKIVRRDNGKVVEFEEVRYGMLMMVLCDREGRVYDAVSYTHLRAHETLANLVCRKKVKKLSLCGY